jgi:pyrroline-5-carboxylate reductase
MQQRIVLVGAGNMGFALAAGALRSGVLLARTLVVIEPDEAKRAALARLGATTHAQISELAISHDASVLLLAIKPQMLASFAAQLHGAQSQRATFSHTPQTWSGVISILAGVPRARLASSLALRCPIIRAMPNLPALVGEGCTALADDGAPAPLRQLARAVFASVSPTLLSIDESLLDAFTGVAGSGPAYVFALVEAMVVGAQEAGLSASDAQACVRQTLLGAAAMLREEGSDAGVLRERVTSPGGTTAAGLAALARAGFSPAVRDAIIAARDRGRELAALAAPAR